jgi:hypothetical protein
LIRKRGLSKLPDALNFSFLALTLSFSRQRLPTAFHLLFERVDTLLLGRQWFFDDDFINTHPLFIGQRQKRLLKRHTAATLANHALLTWLTTLCLPSIA